MAKTRSQGLRSQIKEEEGEKKCKLNKQLHVTKNAKNQKSKIIKNNTTKRKPVGLQNASSRSKKSNEPVPLSSAANSKRKVITTEQVTSLIGYIVNDKMCITAAARKAKISYPAACEYYNEYKDDPEHKIPLARTFSNIQVFKVSQEKIEKLIEYIVQDKMNLTQAANKAKIYLKTARKYYKQYLKDPERKMPVLYNPASHFQKRYTQEQINELVNCINNNNMTLEAAAEKTSIHIDAAKRYYFKYLGDPDGEIPKPGRRVHRNRSSCTNDQVKTLISCIVNKGMILREASFEADMSIDSASKYYKKYLEDPDHRIPTPETDIKHDSIKHCSLDQVKMFFKCIIIDKLTVRQAADKANMTECSGQSYYKRYLRTSTKEAESMDTGYSVEKMKKMIKYMESDTVSVSVAAKRVGIGYTAALKYYRLYMNDPQRRIPMAKRRPYTQDDAKRLINLIERDKMSVQSAARKIEMGYHTAIKYYNAYRKDPEHKIPQVIPVGYSVKQRASDRYSRMIADIYKENPEINPIQKCRHSDSSSLGLDIKVELVEEATKEILKVKK